MRAREPFNWDVYGRDDERRGATVHAEDAAALVQLLGPGSYITARGKRPKLYVQPLHGEHSYDDVAAMVIEHHEARLARVATKVEALRTLKG